MTYSDTRYGGVKRWYSDPPEDIGMRFMDEFKRNACFLCVELENGEMHISGTAFFLYMPYETDPTRKHFFVVTARHTVELLRKRGYKNFYLRINTNEDKADYFKLNREWIMPEDDGFHDIDAAVMMIDPIPFPFTIAAFTSDIFVTPQSINSRYMGIGDEIQILGLFKKREGRRKNIPILRTGTVAAMAEEEIPVTVRNENGDEDVRYYYAYLVEIRSIKGLSGSPVYLFIPPGRAVSDEFGRPTGQGTGNIEMYILGLVRGHWSVEPFEVVIDYANGEDDEGDQLNTGIATVTPITDVLNIINGAKMMKKREEKEKEYIKQRQTTLDAALPPVRQGEDITQEGFEDALKRASRKIEKDEEQGS